jgi:hypothetical protein
VKIEQLGLLEEFNTEVGQEVEYPNLPDEQADHHIVFLSGGKGSWMTAKLVADRYGLDKLVLVFAETYTEDSDLYRFLVESTAALYGITPLRTMKAIVQGVPEVWEEDKRKQVLGAIAKLAMAEIPNFHWLADGRNIWDVFFSERFLGNTMKDPCSKFLKRKFLRSWVDANFDSDRVICHIGYDWSEIHRLEKAKRHWMPYTMRSLLCDPPYTSKFQIDLVLKGMGIEPPSLYSLGFPHNNCGGACVKAGLAQWRLLLAVLPKLFAWMESKEDLFRATIDPDATILKVSRKGKSVPYSLKELRLDVEQQIDLREISDDSEDWGGCGCFAA